MRTNEVVQELRKRVKESSQKEVAEALKFSPQLICDVLKGRRAITDRLANKLGYTIQTLYVKKG